jgi:molybdate transport system substrate-binding protein
VRAGENVDVVVLASDVIDRLIDEGWLLAGSRVDVVKSPIAVAVRQGSARPDISSEAALRQAVAAARSLSYSTGPSGTYLENTFARWGLLAQLRERIVVPPPGVPVASLVADGRAELGFQQLSELLNRPGVDVVGALPDEVQSLTIFSGGIGRNCGRPEAAGELIAFLGSGEVAGIKEKYGLQSAHLR